jgi:hypothetical protein
MATKRSHGTRRHELEDYQQQANLPKGELAR